MSANVCVFGDSITYGASDLEKGGWVTRLRIFLDQNGYDYEIHNQGICGNTSTDLLKRFIPECKARKPSIIIFAIGINDSLYQTYNPLVTAVSKIQFQNNIINLIDKAKKFTPYIIFLTLTPVDEKRTIPCTWDGKLSTDNYSNSNIREFNLLLQKIVRSQKLSLINVHSLISTSQLDDGLHPNALGHEKMFLTVKDYLLSNKFLECGG